MSDAISDERGRYEYVFRTISAISVRRWGGKGENTPTIKQLVGPVIRDTL